MGRLSAIAGVLLLTATHGLAGPEVAELPAERETLPPVECVRLLREARILEMSGQPAAARERLDRAIEAYPEELMTLMALVDNYVRNDAAGVELTRLRGILTERLANPEQPVPRGTLDYLGRSPDTGDQELAFILVAVDQRLAASPDDFDLLRARADLQQRLDREADAHATLLRMIAVRPMPELLFRAVAYEREHDDWTNAVVHLRALIEGGAPSKYMDLVYIEALGRAGMYDEVLERLGSLEADLTRRDSLMRESVADLLTRIAWGLRDLGRADQAEVIFRRVLDGDPHNAAVRQTLLHLYGTTDERLAHRATLDAEWAAEDDPHLLLDEGAKLLASGDAEGAFALLQRAADGLPDHEPANFNLGLAALRLERWDVAERAFEHALKQNSGRAESRLNRGIALQSLQRFDEAIAELQQALAVQPDLFQAHYYLYESYRQLGDTVRSVEHLQKYQDATKP